MRFVTCTRSRKLGNVLYKVEEHEGARRGRSGTAAVVAPEQEEALKYETMA